MMHSSSRPQHASKPRAFTLVEILIVLAIIGILAAILLPVLANAREAGRRAACASNLKQIGLGLQLYAQDHRKFPRSWFGTSNDAPSDAATNFKWMDAIYPYIKNPETFNCASDDSNLPYAYRDGKNYGSTA